MSLTYSLTARAAMASDQAVEVPVYLVEIRHPSLSAPVYLSSNSTHQITLDPYVRGTRHLGQTYLYVRMDMVLPDDQDRSPPRATLVFDNVADDMAAVLRSFIEPADVTLKIVLASNPDAIEAEYGGLQGVRGSSDQSQISLDITDEPLTSEPWPAGRMTRLYFPTLHS